MVPLPCALILRIYRYASFSYISDPTEYNCTKFHYIWHIAPMFFKSIGCDAPWILALKVKWKLASTLSSKLCCKMQKVHLLGSFIRPTRLQACLRISFQTVCWILMKQKMLTILVHHLAAAFDTCFEISSACGMGWL